MCVCVRPRKGAQITASQMAWCPVLDGDQGPHLACREPISERLGSHCRHSAAIAGQCRETLTWPDIRGRTAPCHALGRGRSQPLHQLTIRPVVELAAPFHANAHCKLPDESRPSEIETGRPLSSRPMPLHWLIGPLLHTGLVALLIPIDRFDCVSRLACLGCGQ